MPGAMARVLLNAGQVLGGYEVVRPVGWGGMASVYEVRRQGKTYAMKVQDTRGGDTDAAEAVREAQAQIRVQSPFVLSLEKAFTPQENGDLVVLILPFKKYGSLADLLLQRRLTPDEAVALFVGIVRGVAAAHDVNVIHRDIKPSNVLLDVDVRGVTPLVSDFGIAKVLDSTQYTQSTHKGKGTLGYMAPEQRKDSRQANKRSDLFSLGMVFRDLLMEGPRTDEEVSPDVERWKPLIDQLVREDPEARPESADALIKLIEQELGDLPSDSLARESPLAKYLITTVADRTERRRKTKRVVRPQWGTQALVGGLLASGLLIVGLWPSDEDCPSGDLLVGYVDQDGDGFGTGKPLSYCRGDKGFTEQAGDCDDGNRQGQVEQTYFVDQDSDGHGVIGSQTPHCGDPGPGWALVEGDCDDNDAEVHVDATEICNGKDDDCDRVLDDLTVCNFVWDYANPGTWVANENLCHGANQTSSCEDNTGGGIARLDNVPAGGSGHGTKVFRGLQPETPYRIHVQGRTDESMRAPHNQMVVTLGDVVLTLDQADGPRQILFAKGTVVSDKSGAIELQINATDGTPGHGWVSYHAVLSYIKGTTLPPGAFPTGNRQR